ncbi:MAG TPA: tetratricopeptide repeat protein, partial [Blastocatellia bacterium]|nr:tetratricopeptide repeat protein [Blastocatellia bacterium]
MFCRMTCLRLAVLGGRTLSLTLCSVSLLLLSFVTNPGAKAATHGSPSSRSSVQQTQQPAPNAITLDLNVPLERDLIAGQKHEYQMTLAEGQYASVTVEQRGIDVIVRLIGPDDKQIAEFDSESRLKGEEKVELVAKIAGRYGLIVEAKQPKAAAGGYTVRLDGLRVATERDRSLQEARRLSAECVGLRGAGKFSEALALGERALEIRERTVGKDHADVAQSLFNLANIHKDQGDFDKAEDLYRRALEIREKALGREHPHVAQALNNLAILYKDKGDFANAEQFNRCALDILEKALGPEHPAVAGSLGNLAEVARLRGNYTDAEDLNQRSIEILQKALGPEHPSVAISVNNLANVYKHKGDLVKAEQLYRRALEILQKRLGPEHPNVAALIGNLGEVARLRGDYTTAEQLNQRVLEILEKRLGPEHPNVAFARGNLAMVYRSKGDFIKAEELYRSEREILEKTLGPEHPEVADTLNNLAILYKDKGDFAKAETLHQRALQIREKSLGPEHPEVAESLSNLATLYTARGEFDQAITSQLRANEITEHNIALNLATGSERQKLAYLTSLSEITDRTLSLHARAAPDNSQAQELAATIILQRKGRVLDAMSDSSATLRRRLTTQDHTLLDQLSSATAQLARLVLNGPQKMTLDAHQKRIRALEEEREKLENKISRSSAGFYEPAVPVTLAAVRASIPADAALVEFSAYRPFDPKAGDAKAYGDPRYVACVLRPQGEIQWIELGEARQIDEVIDALRKALRDPQRGEVRRLARAMDEKVMRPVRALLGDATHLLVSPDGALNLIPFEAFVDEQNRYLVERYAFTYLTSGRDLLR